MEIKSKEEQKKIFKNYTDKFILEADELKKNGYIDKQQHSIFVMDEALLVNALFTDYNESFKNLLVLESLFHDIGRFEQLKVTGSFRDNEISQYYPNYIDHGDLGSAVIKKEGLLDDLIPNIRIYDAEVQKVIKMHSKINNDILDKVVFDYIESFKNYDLKELFLSSNSTKEKQILSSVNNAIIQDVDRLDIFRKIVKGIWVPMVTDDTIDPQLFELFKKGKLPSMTEIKKMGKWNANVGHLVRMSFINQMNLVPVLKSIRDENLIDKVFEVSGNSIVAPAYEFAKEQIERNIENSEDGIIINKKR